MEWRAAQVQAVIFELPRTPVDTDILPVWLEAFKVSPQSMQGFQPGQSPISQAAGKVGKHHVALTLQPGRLDVTFSAPNVEVEPFTLLDDLQSSLDELYDLVVTLMAARTIMRLACVMTLVGPVGQRDAVMTALKVAAPPLAAIPSTVRDLNLAFNAQRPMNAAPLTLNRLCRWSASQRNMVMLGIQPDGTMRSGPMDIKDFAALHVDVNTLPSSMPLQGDLTSIFREIVDECKLLSLDTYARMVPDA